jgi:hypothetical protein
LKAGAEKILFMLKLRPVIHEMNKEWIGTDGKHFNITVVMSLYGRDNDVLWGQGVGSCTTMEKKYRYRTTWVEREEVPKEYWKTRNKALLKGMVTKKINGTWMLCEAKKTENEDVAEVWNTVVKMAKKRALVDAVLTIAGVSDLFTQDIEEFSEHEQNTQEDDVETPPESSGKAPQEQKPATTRKDTGNPVGEPQKGISGSPTTDVRRRLNLSTNVNHQGVGQDGRHSEKERMDRGSASDIEQGVQPKTVGISASEVTGGRHGTLLYCGRGLVDCTIREVKKYGYFPSVTNNTQDVRELWANRLENQAGYSRRYKQRAERR